jgi:dTDP-4-dehydrorhamnose reductase
MRILLLGKNGQVGWELQRSLTLLGEVIALGSDSTEPCGDLRQLDGLRQTLRTLRPDVVVNAAAYTAVDKAESELDLARTINATAPGVLADEVARLGGWLLHYSTDYVFDGSGSQAWCEGDPPAPLNVYGQTKLEGEQTIRESGCKHLIFRTSWVYAARGGNFAKTMLRLAQERERLTVIDDQFGAPTSAELLADVSAHALRQAIHRPQDSGLYHLVASGETNWWAYANFVIEQARRLRPDLALQVTEVAPVASSAFVTAAKRPHNSRLDTRKLQTTFDLHLPDWQQGVQRMLAETLGV